MECDVLQSAILKQRVAQNLSEKPGDYAES